MKKVNNLILVGILSFITSCSSSDTSEGVMEPRDNTENPNNGGDPPDTGPVSYAEDIRGILQANCTSCHGNPPTQNAPMSLTTLDLVRSAVNNRGLLTRINSTTNPMPPTGLLPAATRQLLEDWVDLGFPE